MHLCLLALYSLFVNYKPSKLVDKMYHYIKIYLANEQMPERAI
jgi:hypothetical protein